jgi:hypothetical protein
MTWYCWNSVPPYHFVLCFLMTWSAFWTLFGPQNWFPVCLEWWGGRQECRENVTIKHIDSLAMVTRCTQKFLALAKVLHKNKIHTMATPKEVIFRSLLLTVLKSLKVCYGLVLDVSGLLCAR